MLWALLSIFSGLGDAFSFVYMKKLGKLDTYLVLVFRHLITVPFLLLGFLFYEIPRVYLNFFVIAIINVAVLLTATFLMIRSLQISDLSMSVPMLSFTPVFLLLTSYIMLKEIPSFIGLAGIFIVVAGSYIANISSAKYGYLEPLKAIFRQKGIFYMFIVAFLLGIAAPLGKIGINLSNPAFYVFVVYLLASLVLAFLFSGRIKGSRSAIKKNSKNIILLGISTALMELLAAVAVKLAIVPYVISLKRTSVIFSVLLGFFYFKEKNFKEAITGSAIMFIGAALIILS